MSLRSYIIIGILLFIILSIGYYIGSSSNDAEFIPKSDSASTYIGKDTIKIVSKIVDLTKENLDYSQLPSYAKPQSYTILKLNNYYMVKLPHGEIWTNKYKTLEEAQTAINKSAKRCLDRWVETGGLDY